MSTASSMSLGRKREREEREERERREGRIREKQKLKQV